MAKQPDEDQRLTPTEAFGLLGNETRLAILRELAQQRRVNWQFEGMQFADLRKAVGMRDAGTFSYHLDKLTGVFVEKQGDEYVLNAGGIEIADAILTGRYGNTDDERVTTVEYVCPTCSANLQAFYRGGQFGLFCEEHGYLLGTTIPPAAVDGRSMAEVVEIATRDMKQDMERATNGVCFHCWGKMVIRLQQDPPIEHPATGETYEPEENPFNEGVVAVLGCERCETVVWLEPDICVTRHPANIALRYRNDFDVDSFMHLSPQVELERTVTVTSTEPLEVSLTVESDETRVQYVLEEDGTVSSVEHE